MGSWSSNISSNNDESWNAKTNWTYRIIKKVFFFWILNIFWFNFYIHFSVKTFESLREDILSKISDAVDQVSYADGECIVRQGAKGDTCYIVAKGSLRISFKYKSNKINLNFI
jgi:hypothetical protein